jgi:hypothetical protein
MDDHASVAKSLVLQHLARLSKCRRTEANLIAIRHNTHTGRPLGSEEFTRALEKETKRRLAFQRRGPKKKTGRDETQQSFSF